MLIWLELTWFEKGLTGCQLSQSQKPLHLQNMAFVLKHWVSKTYKKMKKKTITESILKHALNL